MAGKVENINLRVIKQCRDQMGLDIADVEKKVPKIIEIEEGKRKPTFKQLNTLSQLYKVPRWVFISENLPEKYVFKKAVPAFRQFANENADIFSHPNIRRIVTQIERYRELMIDLLNDMDEDIIQFNPPDIRKQNFENIARRVRDWLDLSNRNLDFWGLKEILESNGIFIFLTSKYKSWSHIDRGLLRGFAIFHEIFPIIVINDSDAKKAQSFTLFHELGHLLRRESSLDNWDYHHRGIEKWCDQFAGNVLMPVREFTQEVIAVDDLNSVKKIARTFKVSPYACLVRLKQLMIIDQDVYDDFERQLINEFQKYQKKLKETDIIISRNRAKEILNQYGHIFSKVVFQAYYHNEIGFHKLSKLFGLKHSSYLLEMEGKI